MSFHNDSSREFILVDGKWVIRPYSQRRSIMKKKADNAHKTKSKKIDTTHRKIKRQRIKDSAATTKGRKCSTMSPGEKRIADFLIANSVQFFREHYFPNLYNKVTNRLLYFDFYVPKYNLVIEYDGIQHFKNVYGNMQLADQKERDKQKWIFCKKHKIHFLRIKCFDQKDIEVLICKKFDEIAPIF